MAPSAAATRPAISPPRSMRRSARERLKEELVTKGKGNFGSGWTWLVKEGDGLAIINTDDADTPIKHGKTPLLTVDVWEHAYYLDYQNARPAYLETFVDKLLNWEFAASNFAIDARRVSARAAATVLPDRFRSGRASVRRVMSILDASSAPDSPAPFSPSGGATPPATRSSMPHSCVSPTTGTTARR